jgi:hypothetical protein
MHAGSCHRVGARVVDDAMTSYFSFIRLRLSDGNDQIKIIRWLGAEQNGSVWARLIRTMRQVSHCICKTYYCAADGRSETGAMPGDGKPSWTEDGGEEQNPRPP